MPPFRKKLFAVAAKIETTPGVSSAPTYAADALRLIGTPDAVFTPIEDGSNQDEQTGDFGGSERSTPVGWIFTTELAMRVPGKLTAAGKPRDSVLKRGLGFSEIIDATPGSEKVTYRDLSSGHENFTVRMTTEEEEVIVAVGCACTRLVVRKDVGRPGLYTYSIRGYVPVRPAVEPISGLVLPGGVASAWKGNTVGLGPPGAFEWGPATGAGSLKARTFELTIENTFADQLSAGASDITLEGVVITDRNISASMDVQKVTLAAFDPYDVARSSGQGAGGAAAHDTRIQVKHGLAQYFRETINTGYWEMNNPGKPVFDQLAGWNLNGPVRKFNGPSGRFLEFIYD